MSVASRLSRGDEGINILIVEVVHGGCSLWRGRARGGGWQTGSWLVARCEGELPYCWTAAPISNFGEADVQGEASAPLGILRRCSEWLGGACKALDPWRACPNWPRQPGRAGQADKSLGAESWGE